MRAIAGKGPAMALVSALLFGASVPAAKLLLGAVNPVLLAGLLYASAGIVLIGWRLAMPTREAVLPRAHLPILAGAILAGGVLGPLLLLYGLTLTPAANAALLLNLESVFTAGLAWLLFRENFDRWILAGFAAIVGGGLVLSWAGVESTSWLGPLLIALACFLWGVDNNLTQRISGADPVSIAGVKALIAGLINLTVALILNASLPPPTLLGFAALVGVFGYGLSLVLFVLALRHLGAARTGAYFGVAPFFGAALSLAVFGVHPSPAFWIAAALMAIGVWLHLRERHAHWHVHAPILHTHLHAHDLHHQHDHEFEWDGQEPHSHPHAHDRLAHSHAHYPDLHHRHPH